MKAKASAKKTVSDKSELFALLFETGRLIRSEITRDNCPVPSFLHAETLRFIEERGMPTMRDMAGYLKVTPPTATTLIDGFVKDKVVERIPDPSDRRKVRLTLTKKGIKLFAELKRRRTEAFTHILEPLTSRDRNELARVLTIITRAPATAVRPKR